MKIRFEPFGVTTQAEAGTTLLDAAVASGVEIESVCGGRGTCAKCRVIVSGGVSATSDQERRKLSAEELAQGYRLACQALIVSDVEVVVPEESRRSRMSILVEGMHRAVDLNPWAHRYTLSVPQATIADQVPDLENLSRVWREHYGDDLHLTLGALRQLPLALRAADHAVSLVRVDGQVVRVMPAPEAGRVLGIAFDIGTTTVVGYLMDLESGRQLAVSSLLNPQTRYGDDVVSRIGYSTANATGLQTLQSDIVGALNAIVIANCRTAHVEPDDIYAITVVGNTTMHHLFLGVSPAALAQAPYVPAAKRSICVTASEVGIGIYPEAHVWVLPNIAGWVGADTVGVILATGIHTHDDLALAIDIGTNGEMAMGSRQRLITCSTAAGPAFEGAQLSCGMRAADGAIDTVSLDGSVSWHTIGNAPPRGICGSGLVDLVSELLRTGVIDTTGMMRSGDELRQNGHAQLAERVVQVGRQREFHLATAAEGAQGRPVRVTQRDIRELQLAKGAIRAGIQILLKELGIGPRDVRRVYLAGAFGNYIKPASALAIGLMPRFPMAEIVPVGNAAGSGSKMALLSVAARNEASEIVDNVEYLELSGRADFQEEFAAAMVF